MPGRAANRGSLGSMAEPDLILDRHMSDVEALMWNLEKDPHLSSTFANVTIFDVPPDIDRLRTRLVAATQAVPRLRQRVVAALGRLAPPEWREDPDFDIDFHLRRVALPAPGTEEQLFELAAGIALAPFDRTRPLWEFTVVDGLDGGRGAMVQKMHHTITDGEGGVRMSVQFIDLERNPPEPPAMATRTSRPPSCRSRCSTPPARPWPTTSAGRPGWPSEASARRPTWPAIPTGSAASPMTRSTSSARCPARRSSPATGFRRCGPSDRSAASSRC